MALVAYRAHPLAKARFRNLPPRTPHPRAMVMGTVLGACGLAIAIRLRRFRRRDEASSGPHPRQLPSAAKHAVLGATRAGRRGYREASSGERTALNLLGSFGATIGLSRGITYVQTQRQPVLPLKKLRQLRSGHARVQGIALAFASGSLGILLEEDGLGPWLALPYGVGMGLTLDEAAILLELPHGYWTHEHLAAIQAGITLAGAAGIAVRISRRGETASAPSPPHTDCHRAAD